MPAVGPVTYETYTRRDNRTMDKQCSDMILTTGRLIVAGLSFVLLYLATKRAASHVEVKAKGKRRGTQQS